MKNLYMPNPGARIDITQEELDEIRSAESYVTKSGYYSHMVVWETNLIDEMQMLAITAKPKQSIIEKYADNIDVHMALLSTIYMDECDAGTSMGYKKPFGNSDVIGDVIDELLLLGADKKNIKINAEEILKEFSAFIQDFFKDGFEPVVTGFIGIDNNLQYQNIIDKWREIGVEPKHSYLCAWEPDKSALRELKLKEIGI
jgi:hypothetical protein